MNIDEFLIRFVFLLLPGIISSSIYRTLVGKIKQKDWEDFLNILLFSLVNYSIYGIITEIYSIINHNQPVFNAFQALLNKNSSIPWHEIGFSILIGIMTAGLAAYIATHKLINKLGRTLGLTNRFGDEDVWNFFHNSDELNDNWVFVRDHKLNLTYYGFIAAYSDSEKERELILKDVDVYSNSTSEILYSTSSIYLSRDKYDLTIEIPSINNFDKEKTNDTK